MRMNNEIQKGYNKNISKNCFDFNEFYKFSITFILFINQKTFLKMKLISQYIQNQHSN